LTAGWLRRWGLHTNSHNPPNRTVTHPQLKYMCLIETESAYMDQQERGEGTTAFRKQTYRNMAALTRNPLAPTDIRVTKMWPSYDWKAIWEILHSAPISKSEKGDWFHNVHDLCQTNERLHKIHLSTTDKCRHCGRTDSLQHRMTECREGRRSWEWTKNKMASFLHMDPRRIPDDWMTRSQFKFWPPKRHRAILWFVAHVALYRGKNGHDLKHVDYMDFLRRSRWKLYQRHNRTDLVGNYLSIIDLAT
jgi:hypothetical protein